MTQTKTSVSHRVLLVDDDEAVRTMMSATLERKGFEVIPAANVTEALKLIMCWLSVKWRRDVLR